VGFGIGANSDELARIATHRHDSGVKIRQLRESAGAATQAVKRFPNDAQALCMKGIIELNCNQLLKAQRDFALAIGLNPNEPIYKMRLAETYLPEYGRWYRIDNKAPSSQAAASLANPQAALKLLDRYLHASILLRRIRCAWL